MTIMTTSMNELPVLALRDLVVFPTTTIPLLIGRPLSVGALQLAKESEDTVLLVTHKNPNEEKVTLDTVYTVGVKARIVQHLSLEDGNHKILVDCYEKVKLNELRRVTYYYNNNEAEAIIGQFEVIGKGEELTAELEQVYKTVIRKLYSDIAKVIKPSKDSVTLVEQSLDLSPLIINVLASLPLELSKKQQVLEATSLEESAEEVIKILTAEVDVIETQKRIQEMVQQQVSKNQREYYLNEQIKAIHKELDDLNDTGLSELDQLEAEVLSAKMPKEAEEKALREIKRLKGMPALSSEATVSRTYLDWLLKMPWNKRSRLRYSIKKAEEILNRDHSGLEKIKEHILEHLSVISHTKNKKGTILCFIGPPGVGKTSLARSIADATNREFVRMSLGGVSDESEIRGHRRTYIGAMPGKIVQMLTKAKTKNPLILLDELDKTGVDHRGDPADALLEVLDPEQNTAFNDHYLDVDVNLSEVLFIATANSYNIPGPLRDRMDIIELSSYTELEKLAIAKEHLIPKQLDEHKLTAKELQFSDEVILEIVQRYVKEAGVRNLERTIAKICRKFIRERTVSKKKKDYKVILDKDILKTYLGVVKYDYGKREQTDEVGYVNGLAWTQLGGDLLGIEVELIPGKGELITTGSLGDVMKESVRTALTVIRSRSNHFGLPHDFHQKWDIHVHAPEGAVPKDGPSAGAAITLAILSVLLNKSIRSDIAMTGEVTLRGKILQIGGLKEKLLAALRAEVKEVLIPQDNVKDLEEIPTLVKEGIKITPVSTIDEVFEIAFSKEEEPKQPFERFSGFYEFPKATTNLKKREKTH